MCTRQPILTIQPYNGVYIKAVDSPSGVVDHVWGPHKLLTLVILLALQLTLGEGVQQLCMMYRYSSVSSFFNTYSHQRNVNLAATYNMQSSAADLSAWLRLLSMMQEGNTRRVLRYYVVLPDAASWVPECTHLSGCNPWESCTSTLRYGTIQYSAVVVDRVPTSALASKPRAHGGGQRTQ
jgi:hypothetical protein